MTSVVEERHQHAAIELGSELSDESKRFVSTVRGSGRNGIAALKIFRLHKITTPRSLELAGQFPDLVSVQKKGTRVQFFWRPQRESGKTGSEAEAMTADKGAGSPQLASEAETRVATAVQASERPVNDSRGLSELEKDRDKLIGLLKE